MKTVTRELAPTADAAPVKTGIDELVAVPLVGFGEITVPKEVA